MNAGLHEITSRKTRDFSKKTNIFSESLKMLQVHTLLRGYLHKNRKNIRGYNINTNVSHQETHNLKI